MNIQELIETSGLLEEYVLGSLSEKEAQGVACLAKTYPDIQKEIETLQHSLGSYYGSFEKTPPTGLKDKIFAQMSFAEPLEDTEKAVEEQVADTEEQPIIEKPAGVQRAFWPRVSMAASVLLGMITLGLLWQNQNLKNNANGVEALAKTQAAQQRALIAAFQDPTNKQILMAGTEKQPNSSVTVLWNPEAQTVALAVKSLPKAPEGKQYQFWYIGADGPVDMGMLDQDFEGKLLSMKPLSGVPAAFAITLEKAGGVAAPTLEQLYVMGKV